MCPPRTDGSEMNFSGTRIRCLLAYDHVLLRQGLRRLLEDEPDIDVTGEAGNTADCLRKLRELRPDVLVADARTLGLDTAEAERVVRRESPRTKLVLLSAQDEPYTPVGSTQAANAGCVARQTSAAELLEMVRSSCGKGDHAASPHQDPHDEDVRDSGSQGRGLQGEVSARRNPTHLKPAAPIDSKGPIPTPVSREPALTAREREVLKLLAEGKTVRAAADVLGVSSKTVDAHKFNLMRKLGIHNKAELVMWAIRKRIVKIPANF